MFFYFSELSIATVADPWESMLFKLNEFQIVADSPLCSSGETLIQPTKLNNWLSDKNNLRNEMHIVIVGAGIAGLTCAFHLAKNNFSNISIYEAQDKIGGRVSTVDYGKFFYVSMANLMWLFLTIFIALINK